MISPLRYVISIGKRSKITIFAISIVVMFITSTFIIVYSFEVSNKELVGRFESQFYMVSSTEDILKSRVPLDLVDGAYIFIIPAKINNVSTYALGIYDPHSILGDYYQCAYGDVILGKYYSEKGYVDVHLNGTLESLRVSKIMDFKYFPNYWMIINYSMAMRFQSQPNLVITDRYVEVDGYVTTPMVDLSQFYFKSSEEITKDLAFFAVISIVVVYFFINALLTMEIRESTKRISVMRAIGSTTTNIGAIYFLRAMFIGFSGMILGTAIGILLSYLLAALFPLSGMLSYFLVYVPSTVFITNLFVAGIGASIAAIQPVRSAMKIGIVDGLKGVVR